MAGIKINFHSLTILPQPLPSKLNAAARGYGGICLHYDDLKTYSAQHPIETLRYALQERRLDLVEVSLPLGWQCAAEDEKIAKFLEAEQCFQWANTLQAGYVVACSALEGDLDQEVEDFARLSDLASSYGMKLAYEAMSFSKSFYSLDLAIEIVRRAQRPNTGILLDLFHFHRGKSSWQSLQSLKKEELIAIHINDDPAESEANDGDAVFPGDGAIPIDHILSEITQKGWTGPVSVEVYNPLLWERDPVDVAHEGLKKSLQVLSRNWEVA